MEHLLNVYNTLTRRKEPFEPLRPPHVGMYVCGPTVYGDAHLGHARPAVVFDLIYRYLSHLGYRVRYVRNITDVGHLEHDSDAGEDKVARKARLEQLEPMEVAQYYSDRYHEVMDMMNVSKPSIEPRASGHIIEQMEMIKKIMEAGYAYEVNGSVYFDIARYSREHHYGILSGRVVDDLLTYTRELEGQEEKRNPADFALWKKASSEHIMQWPSPWSQGFPGWHLECSAMGTRYLGERFDIHGGGMDLLFPHHESEIAQSMAANGIQPVKYWLHNNMVTLNGQKMGKSLGNAIPLYDVFAGIHQLLEKPYSPMTIRFFILQAHYRGTLDFSNEALQAAEKGLKRLTAALSILEKLEPAGGSSWNPASWRDDCYVAMNDDFNSPALIAQLFEGVRMIHALKDKKETLVATDLETFSNSFRTWVVDVLGLIPETSETHEKLTGGLMELIIRLRQRARENRDFTAADMIRDELARMNITLRDTRDGTDWSAETD
ncbi:MAG: cysteine--tRNA ligase [Bacteroidales bacterium]|nr:cysteine--tRNA ligase [Bacteroidales bacterium]